MERYGNVDILYEDNHILVVNKPAGMLSQGDKTGDDSILDVLKAYIKEKYHKPGNVFLGSVHRLDRPVSGVMVFARTSKALTRLTKALKERKIKKRYYAIVEGVVKDTEGKLVHHLLKDKGNNTVKAFAREGKNTKEAALNYKVKGVAGGFTLLDIDLITGRPHQIRVQLAAALFPIAGDVKYGSKHRFADKNICLHSYNLSFMHPVRKEEMNFVYYPGASRCIWERFKKFF